MVTQSKSAPEDGRCTEMGSLQIKVQGTQEEGPSSLLDLPYEEKKTPYVKTPSSLPSFLPSVCACVHLSISS